MNTTERNGLSGTERYPLPVEIGKRRMAIFAEGGFSPLGAKTAVCLVRYVPDEIVAVIDSVQAGSTVEQALGFGGAIPIVSSFGEALTLEPDMLVLGTAPKGGRPTGEELRAVEEAIAAGLHIVNGMHRFLETEPEFAEPAARQGVVIWDVRRPPSDLPVSTGSRPTGLPVLMTVGSDCNTGKMTAAVEIVQALVRKGVSAGFAASGQTGIMISGRGIPIDAVTADFIGGATERLVAETAPGKRIVVVEGQGSILHPGYVGVTVGMLAGALPDGLVLCHQPSRSEIRNCGVAIPPLPRLVDLYSNAAPGIKEFPVLCIALNTFDLEEEEARDAIASAGDETGLPATDPVRFGPDVLIEALRSWLSI
jgi:uncharacterized NAD-dependent epimerase/dehydratase family protein